MKMKILTEIQNRCDNLKEGPKKKVITSILKNDNWYKEVNFDTIINILHDLKYSVKEAEEIYKILLLEK